MKTDARALQTESGTAGWQRTPAASSQGDPLPSVSTMLREYAVDQTDTITVALAGQPNVGKSTVFNLLTGLSQHVGNWPGKTIEQRTGTYYHSGVRFEITDLPGTYSLTANSAEEVITRDFVIVEHPDVVVAIISAATLERNLYLVVRLAPGFVFAFGRVPSRRDGSPRAPRPVRPRLRKGRMK